MNASWRGLVEIFSGQTMNGWMAALGQMRKSRAAAGMSAAGGEADVSRAKADIELRMSAPEGKADIAFERQQVRY